MEERAFSGVHMGARAGNTPQHHLQRFGQQVCRLLSVLLPCYTAPVLIRQDLSVVRENGTQILLTHVRNAGSAKVPRSAIDEDGKYQVNIMAYNHFGSSQSDPVSLCLEDMGKLGKFPSQGASSAQLCHGLNNFLTLAVIPEAPHIMQITFESTTLAALLRWNTTESSGYLKSWIRLHTGNGSWVKSSFREAPDMEPNWGSDPKPSCFQEAREATDFREGLVRVLGLAPLTEYTFQMRTCQSGRTLNPSCTNSKANSHKSFCSQWSLSAKARSPGKGKLAALMPM